MSQKKAARRLAISKGILANWMAASYPIEIWSRLTEAPIKVGDMICKIGETGQGKGSFRYDRQAGWRLSPSFDLLPDVGRNGEHVLFFDLGGYYPGRMAIEKLGRSWGIRQAKRIVEEVYEALSAWKEEFSAAGVPDEDIAIFGEIDSNLGEK